MENQLVTFSGPHVGYYKNKLDKMNSYMKKYIHDIMQHVDNKADIQIYLNRTYKWKNSCITFLENGVLDANGKNTYYCVDIYRVKCDFDGEEYLLKFDENYSSFISIRKKDFDIVFGIEDNRKKNNKKE